MSNTNFFLESKPVRKVVPIAVSAFRTSEKAGSCETLTSLAIPRFCQAKQHSAYELAQKETETNSSMPNPANNVPNSAIYARVKVMDFKPKHKEFYGATTSKHLQKIDKTVPGKHTVKIYNALNRTAAAILAQLRTNISRLNIYLSKINVADTDRCECGMTETVPHFLFS
jgi:hypothetical protein